MATATFAEKIEKVGKLTNPYESFGMNQNSFSSIKRVIQFITDKESLTASKVLLDLLKQNEEPIPIELIKDAETLENVESSLKRINEIITTINGFQSAFDNIFALCAEDGVVIIDDDNTSQLIENIKQSKDILVFYSDYFALVLKVYKNKADIAKNRIETCTFDELIDKINSAA